MQFVEHLHSFHFSREKDRCQGGLLLLPFFPILLTKHFPVRWAALAVCVLAAQRGETAKQL